MSTGLKMAKASQDEIDRAIKLVHLLDATIDTRAFDRPYLPAESEDGEDMDFDEENVEDCQELIRRIRELCPGLMRVVFGFQSSL